MIRDETGGVQIKRAQQVFSSRLDDRSLVWIAERALRRISGNVEPFHRPKSGP